MAPDAEICCNVMVVGAVVVLVDEFAEMGEKARGSLRVI